MLHARRTCACWVMAARVFAGCRAGAARQVPSWVLGVEQVGARAAKRSLSRPPLRPFTLSQVPVQPGGDLTACLRVAIQFAEDGTHNEGNIERYRYFMSEVMPDCFDKVLFSKETSGWNHDIMRSVAHTPFNPRPP